MKFKSWANVDGTPCTVDFESTATADLYSRYGTSTDAEAVNGTSEWNYKVNIAPKWFTFHVNFNKMVPTTVQKIQWMNSLSNATISLDSILLIKDADLPVLVSSIANDASVRVYPNPTNGAIQLKFSQMPKAGTLISVYNQTGLEIIKTVAGDMNVNLDLSGKPAGLYFIKVEEKVFKLILK